MFAARIIIVALALCSNLGVAQTPEPPNFNEFYQPDLMKRNGTLGNALFKVKQKHNQQENQYWEQRRSQFNTAVKQFQQFSKDVFNCYQQVRAVEYQKNQTHISQIQADQLRSMRREQADRALEQDMRWLNEQSNREMRRNMIMNQYLNETGYPLYLP